MEKNKHILERALQAIPTYSPPEVVWEAIEDALPEQGDSHTIELPQYTPPDFIWEHLDKELTAHESNVAKLPTHEPPAKVWTNIEEGLEREVIVPINRKRTYTILSIAASVAVLVAFFFLIETPATEGYEISYSEETIDATITEQDWDDDNEAFELITQLCEEEIQVCKEPEFKALKTELDELEDARVEVKEAIGAYGDDPQLIAQLSEIEMERSDILKEMIARI